LKALQNLGGKKTELEKLNCTLQPYDLHFGYRVMDEIALFVQNAKNAPDVVGRLNEDEALDYAVLMKVLPKFHGPRQKLEKPLWEVLNWCLQSPLDNKEQDKRDELPQRVWECITGKKEQPSETALLINLKNGRALAKSSVIPTLPRRFCRCSGNFTRRGLPVSLNSGRD
jgi:5-methylcytosine-specific restriction endonuclease McrBC GTP-binding regulatory subunit McrB